MRNLSGLLVLCVAGSAPALAEDHAIGARVGLLGIGVEYSYRFSDRLTIRGGVNGSGLSFDQTESGIDYGFDFDFDSISVGLDVRPLKGKFRVSVGALKNDSSLSATSRLAQSVTIGDTTYQAADVGTVRGRIGFDGTAPFAGFGWNWLPEKKLGIALDIGVLRQGSPVVSLGADGPIADDADFMSDLAAEELELEQSLDDFDIYPYAMLGMVFRF